MITKELPKEISINKLKDLFGILKHTYSEIYVDEYGIIKGLSNYEYIMAKSIILDSNPTYNLMRGRYISFNSSYSVLKDLKKKDARVVYDELGDIVGIININDEVTDMRSPGIWFYKPNMVPSLDVLFEKYNKYKFLNDDKFENVKCIDAKSNSNELIAFKTIIASKIFNGSFDNVMFSRIENMPNIDKTFVAKPEKLSSVTFKKCNGDIGDTSHLYNYWCIRCEYCEPSILCTDVFFHSISLD